MFAVSNEMQDLQWERCSVAIFLTLSVERDNHTTVTILLPLFLRKVQHFANWTSLRHLHSLRLEVARTKDSILKRHWLGPIVLLVHTVAD